ncbi:hypothetical protein RSAG8_11151, partial [Rhizoctonia solani AG-8 WAC10335]
MHANPPRHSSPLVKPLSPGLPLDNDRTRTSSPDAPNQVRRQAFPDRDVDNELLDMDGEEDEPEEEIFDELAYHVFTTNLLAKSSNPLLKAPTLTCVCSISISGASHRAGGTRGDCPALGG